ncbi:unnamed protein product [Menidia menidia]|uniref:(Atlantic silverside) hypothetical protein n=1 Tax=Menidia menidia TaxID=238744 RepID=A0A8S4BG07_9TELE|nr:unnamed protein product [Menidia menidia]
MGDKKSPTRPKRQAKQTADDGYWDCSVCTFRNTAEAFKCSICDVRKGTSTRHSSTSAAAGSSSVSVSPPAAVGGCRRRAAGRSPSHRKTNPRLCLLHRKPRINSQLVAQQVAQQYPMPPPPKKERRERSERMEKERPDGEGERAVAEGRPEDERPDGERPEAERPDVEPPERDRPEAERPEAERPEAERPERVRPEADTPEKGGHPLLDKEQPIKDKPDREKDISPAVTKKPGSKKTRSVTRAAGRVPAGHRPPDSPLSVLSPRPKSDSHQSPPSDKQSIQSGKSATKTNKNSHISRPKLKNIDRSTAEQLAITVGNVTVIITDFKEKIRSSSTSSSTITSSAGSEQQHQSSGSESMDKGSSRASTPKGDLSVGHDESF